MPTADLKEISAALTQMLNEDRGGEREIVESEVDDDLRRIISR